MVISVKAPDGGADMLSTMISVGETVDACPGACSLMASKWLVKMFKDSSRSSSCPSDVGVNSLRLNIVSEESGDGVRLGDTPGTSSRKELPSK